MNTDIYYLNLLANSFNYCLTGVNAFSLGTAQKNITLSGIHKIRAENFIVKTDFIERERNKLFSFLLHEGIQFRILEICVSLNNL